MDSAGLAGGGAVSSTAHDLLGRVDEALRLADRAFADAESAAHAPTLGYVLLFAARLGLVRGNPEAVATYS